jgi:hypothetical protein
MPKTRTKEAALPPAARPAPVSSAAIFARLWETDNGQLSPALARHVLKLGFSAADQARMHELAAKNQEGTISPAELEELDSYVTVADLLGILKSKARQRLQYA